MPFSCRKTTVLTISTKYNHEGAFPIKDRVKVKSSIIVINPLRIARESISRVLNTHRDLNVVSECSTIKEALRAILKHKHDVAIIEMLERCPSDIQQIFAVNPATKVVVSGLFADRQANARAAPDLRRTGQR